ncbi:hypothetical protein [Paracoccus sp. (in: a-proteobacteria)]|uniref:hypothetical protein n=1 Tax=Paracoccus sp. TaxID=267 RepID=UPI00396C85E2
MIQTPERSAGEVPFPEASVEFSMNIVQNLIVVMEATADGGPVTVELRKAGLYAVTPEGQRLFLGPSAPPAPKDA